MKIYFFFTFIIIQSQSQISIPYEHHNNKYTITFSLGTPPYRQYKIIDQMNPFTLIISEVEVSAFLRSKIILKQDNITYQNESILAYLIQDKIAFIKDYDFKYDTLGYKFYYIKNKYFIRKLEEGLSLALRYQDTSFSIVHLFHQKKLINKLSYSFEPKGYFGGNIHFGSIPNDILPNYHSYGHCRVDKQYNSWGCKVKKIIIGNEQIEIKAYGIFNGGYPDVAFPAGIFKEFVRIIRNYVFCTEYVDIFSSYISCKRENIEYLNITFIFDGLKANLKLGDFFNCSHLRCTSRIISDKLYKTQFVFGALFLYQYLSIYDYENQMISFYSEKNNTFEIHDFSEIHYFDSVFKMNIFILVNGIIMLLISLFNKKQQYESKM